MKESTKMETTAFWDNIAEKYAKRPIQDLDAYHKTLARTQSYLGAEDHVLEVGCGSGSTALLLAPHVRKITASDISPGMIRIARAKAEDEGIENADFLVSDVSGTGNDGATYDAVLAHNLLHLVEDPEAAIRSFHDILKPGGFFISKTVTRRDGKPGIKLFTLRMMIRGMQLLGKAPSHVEFKEISAHEEMIRGAGFEIVETMNAPDGSLPNRYIVARKRAS